MKALLSLLGIICLTVNSCIQAPAAAPAPTAESYRKMSNYELLDAMHVLAADERLTGGRDRDQEKLIFNELGSRKLIRLGSLKYIASGKVTLGMTENEVMATWGRPQDVHETLNASGRSEQWCYGEPIYTSFVHFRHGVVTSVQD